MAFSRNSFPHILSAALIAGAALVPAGCGGDGVNSYTVPRTSEPTPPAPPPAAGEYRMLGLMVPAGNPVWFFKYSGPTDEITKYEADFDKLTASVKFGGAGMPEFTPPDGWERGPGRGDIVLATVVTKDGKQEVSLSKSGGGTETNLSRWVGQIGLRSARDDVAKYTKAVDGNGVKVLRVDLRGPNNPATKRAGAMPVGHP
jgi:hypothetical protein